MKQCIQCGAFIDDKDRVCPKCGRKTKDAISVIYNQSLAPQANITESSAFSIKADIKHGLPINGFGVIGMTFAVLGLFLWWTLIIQLFALIFSLIGFAKASRRCCNFSVVWGIIISILEIVVFVCCLIWIIYVCDTTNITFEEFLKQFLIWFSKQYGIPITSNI